MAEQEGTEFGPNGEGSRRRLNGRMTRVFRPTEEEALLRSPDLPPPIWEDAPGFVSGEQVDEMLRVLSDLPQAENLLSAMEANTQVRWIMEDPDVAGLARRVLAEHTQGGLDFALQRRIRQLLGDETAQEEENEDFPF